jgi:hypothetical protein
MQRTAFLRKAVPYLTPKQNRFGRVRLVSLTMRFGVEAGQTRLATGWLVTPPGFEPGFSP